MEGDENAVVDFNGGDTGGDTQESTRVAEDEDGTKGESGDVKSNGGNHAGEETEVGRDGADGDETTEANVGWPSLGKDVKVDCNGEDEAVGMAGKSATLELMRGEGSESGGGVGGARGREIWVAGEEMVATGSGDEGDKCGDSDMIGMLEK
ncbi:hypothetical protein B0H19DRAFT_1231239 [Mycena capillaripes]|nr:hypothetical protein B0H19DRAFT_1231239 [Mycena capillaripes]